MISQLTNREIKLLIGVGILFLFLLIFFGISSFKKKYAIIVESKKIALNDKKSLYAIGREYKILQDMANTVANKSGNRDIAPDIESILDKNSLKAKAIRISPSNKIIENKYMKYQIDITLKDITSLQLLTLIKDIEEYQSVFIKIENLRSKPTYNKPGVYQASLQVATFGAVN